MNTGNNDIYKEVKMENIGSKTTHILLSWDMLNHKGIYMDASINLISLYVYTGHLSDLCYKSTFTTKTHISKIDNICVWFKRVYCTYSQCVSDSLVGKIFTENIMK